VIVAAVRAASGPAPSGTPFVAAAYIFFLLVILIYVTIMGIRLSRSQREILRMKAELDELDRRERAAEANEAADAGKRERVA
jgi:hypothetical protein